MDGECIWLVPENEEEREKYKLILDKLTDKHSANIYLIDKRFGYRNVMRLMNLEVA